MGGNAEGGRLAEWKAALERLTSGESALVDAVPGAGKTTLAKKLALEALATSVEGEQFWAPTVILTPDRRRASHLDLEISRSSGGSTGRLLEGPGSHRLVRSVNSYAHLAVGLWRTERDDPLGPFAFTSGAKEDAWLTGFLARVRREWEDIYAGAVMESPLFRMELRNVIARSGEVGLSAEDLLWLGEQIERPLWRLAAQAYGEYAGLGNQPFATDAKTVDAARLPRIAAHLIEHWDSLRQAEGVHPDAPVPRLLIVDDVQDMPPSAIPLIRAAAERAEQVVLLSSPTSATAQFRGGRPDLGNEIAALLNLPTVKLTEDLRSASSIVDVANEVAFWLGAPIARETLDAQGAASSGVIGQVTTSVVATETRRDQIIAQTLRRHHLHDGIAWEDMAVIVRNSAEVEPLRRRLARLEVPLHAAERPIQLAKAPLPRILLEMLELGGRLHAGGDADPHAQLSGTQLLGTGPSGPSARDGQFLDVQSGDVQRPDREELQQAALRLLASPIVSADSLALFRLIRDLRASDPEGPLARAGVLDLLELEDPVLDPLREGAGAARRRVLAALKRARKIWHVKDTAWQEPAQQGLWEIWDAADLAERLRDTALVPSGDDPARSEIAADSLDSVMALFRKADLWQQEQTELGVESAASAYRFADETLRQVVATDSLARAGLRDPGVAVLTASQAAGQEWEAVCIAGPQLGSWPSSGADSLAQLERLRLILDDATERGWPGEVPIEDFLPDLGVTAAVDYQQTNAERRHQDARIFMSAVTRARTWMHFVAVESEDQVPSPFLVTLARAGLVPPLYDHDGNVIYAEAVEDLDLTSLVAFLRRQLTAADADDEERIEAAKALALLSLEEVRGADPEAWAGMGSISTDAPILEAGKVSLSPSRLETAEACELQWLFRTVGGDDQDAGEGVEIFSRAALGNLIHKVAEDHPHGSLEALQESLDRRWESLGLDQNTHWGRYWRQRAETMVARLATHFAGWHGQVLTEERMKFEAGDGIVYGRIDRLEIDEDGSARVVDIKTGRGISERAAQENLQLLAYQAGVSAMGRESAGAALLQVSPDVSKAFVAQSALDTEQIAEFRSEMASVASRLSGATFEARVGAACRFCPFLKSCPAKQGKGNDSGE